MEENNNNEKSVNADELKQQTVNTAKQVKETMKNVNIKEETMATKGAIMDMWKDPIGTVERVAEDKENKFFKTSLFLIIVWVVVILIDNLIYGLQIMSKLDKDLGFVFKNYVFKKEYIFYAIAPILTILAYSVIAYVLNKNNKKQLPEVISVVTVAYLPVIAGRVISLLTLISNDMSKLTSPIVSILSTLTVVLLYFGLKKLFNENEDKQFIKKYILIIALYELVGFVLSFAKINI